MLKIYDLQIEYKNKPIGLDEKNPAFSSNRKNSVLSMGKKYHSPGHHYDYNGPDGGCQI